VHFENTALEHACKAYFARAISYMCKMFMKLTTGTNAIKLLGTNFISKPVRLTLAKLFILLEMTKYVI
jgi:hypothetical protein